MLLEAAEEAPLAQAELAGQELSLWDADAQALEDGAAHLIEKALLRGDLTEQLLGEPLEHGAQGRVCPREALLQEAPLEDQLVDGMTEAKGRAEQPLVLAGVLWRRVPE